MNVNSIAESRGLSMYRISKSSGIPYATVNDIFCGRARLEKCSAETVFHLAKVLGVSMESLIEPCFGRIDFELFKTCATSSRSSGTPDLLFRPLKTVIYVGFSKKAGIPNACIRLQCLITSVTKTGSRSVRTIPI